MFRWSPSSLATTRRLRNPQVIGDIVTLSSIVIGRKSPLRVFRQVAQHVAASHRGAQFGRQSKDVSREFGVDVLDRLRGLERAEDVPGRDMATFGRHNIDHESVPARRVDERDLDDDRISHRVQQRVSAAPTMTSTSGRTDASSARRPARAIDAATGEIAGFWGEASAALATTSAPHP